MMRRTIALLWLPVPLVLLSALIHTADADVGGISGLTSPRIVGSVLLYAAMVVVPALSCLAARVCWGSLGFWIPAPLVATGLAHLVVAGGSTATTTPGIAWSFIGALVVILATLALAVLPAAAVGWPAVSGGETT